MGKQASQGSTSENQRRGPQNQQRGEFSTLNRMLLGQMVNPPDTAISTPLQQSISHLQSGGLANRLSDGFAQGLAAPGQAQPWGMQSREQLGLPSRDSYFTFKPTPEEVASLGAVPPISPSGGGMKKKAAFDRLSGDDSLNPKQQKRLDKLSAQHPEWGNG